MDLILAKTKGRLNFRQAVILYRVARSRDRHAERRKATESCDQRNKCHTYLTFIYKRKPFGSGARKLIALALFRVLLS